VTVEVPSRRRSGTPTAREVRVRAALVRWHGLPGQRERRRRANGAGQPATGVRLRQRRSVRRPPRSGRHRDRVTDLAPGGNGAGFARLTGSPTPVTGVGQPTVVVGAAHRRPGSPGR
jgi:hypothetical protein